MVELVLKVVKGFKVAVIIALVPVVNTVDDHSEQFLPTWPQTPTFNQKQITVGLFFDAHN